MSERGQFAKLKPGPGRSPEDVRASQRARLHASMIELVAECSYAGVTVRALTRTSNVSTRTFYAHFAGVEDCLSSAYRSIVAKGVEQLGEALAAAPDLDSALRWWVLTLADCVARNPRPAALALVDCYDGGPSVASTVSAARAELERVAATGPEPLSPLLAAGLVAGIERVVRAKLLAGRHSELPGIADDLAQWATSIRGGDPGAASGRPGPPARDDAFERLDPGLSVLEAVGGDRGRILTTVAKFSLTGRRRALTASRLRREAGVTRGDFDAIFDSVESCFLVAAELLAKAAARRALQADGVPADWDAAVSDYAVKLCSELSRSHLLARLAFVDLLAFGKAGLSLRERLLAEAAHELRARAPEDRNPGELSVEASLAAGWRVIQAELEATGMQLRPATASAVAHFILAPAASVRY